MSEKDTVPIELRSEKVNDILGHIPNWIVRWGMLLFFIIIGLLLAGSWVFKYPKIVRSRILVTTENPPSNAIARTSGKIVKLFVTDGQEVEEGQVLALIENPANFEDVQKLNQSIADFRPQLAEPQLPVDFLFPYQLSLGEIQTLYASFLKNYEDLKNFNELNYHVQKINSLKQEISRYQAYTWTLKKQSAIQKGEQDLVQNQFNRDSLLFRQGVIPQADYERSKSNLLQKQRAYEESRSLLVSNDIQISKIEQQILDLELQKNSESAKLRLAVLESFDNITAAIASWEQKYVLRTNVKGMVSYSRIWSENLNVREGELVISVVPENAGEIVGIVELSMAGSGKVKPGQKVNVKFEAFPYMEYGMVTGLVKTVSQVPSNQTYAVLVTFPEGLKTTYNTEINFNQDMQGEAEIITDDERLLERITNPVKAVIQRQKNLQGTVSAN
jgi:HlyD family secretion protein